MNTTVKRSLSGIVFLAVMVGFLLAGRYWFISLFAFILAQMLREFYEMTLGPKHKAVQLLSMLMALVGFAVVAVATGPSPLPRWTISILIPFVVFLMILMLFDHQDFKEYAYIFTGLLYIGLPLALSPYVVSTDGGGYSGLLMLAFFCIIWASDVGAYCFGMLLGQKVWPAKMCPDISPKKSWVGFVGGLVTALLAAYILEKTGMLPDAPVHVLVMAALMHVAGVCGDLFESLWKRQFGLKDSGNLIPGHGGLMDRFDSALFAIPIGFVYLLLIGLV